MNPAVSIAKNIRDLRITRDLSQQELAECSGVNYNTLIKLENGYINNPTIKTLKRLANALNVRVDDFFEVPDKNGFYYKYIKADEGYNTRNDRLYENLVNFSQTKDEPIHRWFYYVEGYSPQLVKNIFQYLNIDKNVFVFDPFLGSGTTLFVAKELGMHSSGFEINPFSSFAARVKTQNYSNEDIKYISDFEIPSFIPASDVYEKYELKIIDKLFSKEKLSKIELLKSKIKSVPNKKARDLLFFALLSILEDVSNYRKGGNGLKRKTVNKDLDPFEEFAKKIQTIKQDLNTIPEGPEPEITTGSCLNIEKYDFPKIGISVFSPPYANCFDPFEVYKVELWLGEFVKSYKELRKIRKNALTSNLNADVKKEIENQHRTKLLTEILDFLKDKDLWDKRLPKMIDTYFYEMSLILESLFNKTKDGGYCVIVVGNSAYGNLAVPTDILLAQLGERAGFSVKEIVVARKNETSSQQHKKLGKNLEYMRESLVILKK